jgi:hypothetical protein
MSDKEFGVYVAIRDVQGDLSKIGISKDKKNAQQGYNFRGIDDVYDVLAPLLAKHSLCILPRVISREVIERQSSKGNALFYVTVECEFDLVSAVDGSIHTVKTYGEAMDSADKATNKAMSAAYKYAAFQTFCIPVDVEDADSTTHEVKGKKKVEDSPKPPVSTNVEKPKPDEKKLDTASPLHKKIEAMIQEAKFDRENFKEWLYGLAWIELQDGKPSFMTITETRAKQLVDKWDSAKKTYTDWKDKQANAPS